MSKKCKISVSKVYERDKTYQTWNKKSIILACGGAGGVAGGA